MKKNKTITRSSLSSLLLAAPAADAIVVTYNVSTTITFPTNNALYWDIDGGVIHTANLPSITDFTAGFQNPYNSADVGFFMRRGPTTTTTNIYNHTVFLGAQKNTNLTDRSGWVLTAKDHQSGVRNVGTNYAVNAFKFSIFASYRSQANLYTSATPINETFFIGFKFRNPSTGIPNYGWAEMEWNNSPLTSASLTINRWAYENTGNEIFTPVPEPTTTVMGLGALALGAAGLSQWRKRKQAA